MRPEAGGGAGAGAGAGAAGGRPRRPQGGHPSHGGNRSFPMPDWHRAPEREYRPPQQSTPKTQWGVPLNPPHAQREIEGNLWSRVMQQVYRPEDVRDETEIANRKAEAAEQRTRTSREKALRGDTPKEATLKPSDAEPMTWHEYNLLTPQQRAAIDFNTMLVRAVRKDLHTEYEPDKQQRLTYDRSIEKMFGSGERGSETYAPETLSVLKQLDFKDKAADLDDFLGLKVAITEDDLDNISLTTGTPGAVQQSGFSPSQNEAMTLKRELATATQTIESKLAEGNKVIQSMTDLAGQERNFIIKQLGGMQNTMDEALGFQQPKWVTNQAGQAEPGDLNTFFIDAFDKLANKKLAGDKGELMGAIRSTLSPSEYQAFISYANTRSNNAQQFGQPLSEAKGVKYRSPEDFRKMLGLGRGTEE